jgi:hypothetical protein
MKLKKNEKKALFMILNKNQAHILQHGFLGLNNPRQWVSAAGDFFWI